MPALDATRPARCSGQGHQNPLLHREKERQAVSLAAEHTFEAVYEKWLAHRSLKLKEGRQSTLVQIRRAFDKDVLPALRKRSIYEINRADLLDVVDRIERRKALSVAEKVMACGSTSSSSLMACSASSRGVC